MARLGLPRSATRALPLLLGFAGALAGSMEDAETYLQTVGVPAGLPKLSVKYEVGGWGKKLRVDGAATEVKAGDVGGRPSISWDPHNTDGHYTNKFVLLMVAPDVPARASAIGDEAGTRGPEIHWLAVNCKDSEKSCDDIIHYQPPNPQAGSGVHRYIFILFVQTAPLDQQVMKQFLMGSNRERWRFAEFVSAAEKSMQAVEVNFFYASAEGPASETPPKEPPKEPLKMQPPREVLEAAKRRHVHSPPSATPLGPAWTSKPKHDEL